MIAPLHREAQTDSSGRFVLDGVPAGEWVVTFTHPALDSLAVSGLETKVHVFAGTSATAELATPSLETIRTIFCAGTPDSLSPTVAFGAVRTATVDPALRLSLRWLAGQPRLAGAHQPSVRLVRADGWHQWVACGVPWGAAVRIGVSDSTLRSTVHFVLGPRGIASHDVLLVSGTVALRGTVRDADNRPVVGAHVGIAESAQSATTDAAGEFAISGIPGGTQSLDVRAPGWRPWLASVIGGGAPVLVALRPLQPLSGDVTAGIDRLRFEARRDIAGRVLYEGAALPANLPALEQTLPTGTVSFWLDGRPVPRAFALVQPRGSWRAIEIYARGSDAPVEWRAVDGAVVLLWTSAADWGF